MNQTIKTIRITSTNICYAPQLKDDEVVQKLTISSSGRVWFSAKNFQQFLDAKGTCRKKQVSIGKWKSEFLFSMIENMSDDIPNITDVGSFTVEIIYDNDRTRVIEGPLTGNILSHAYGNENNVDLTRLIRRIVPVYGLWVFDSSMSPDYEGKKAIYLFAESWEKYFENPDSSKDFDMGFGLECEQIGFQMDSGERFIHECKIRGYKTPFDDDTADALKKIDDIEIIGSGTYSYWRYLTHWAGMYQLDKEVCARFLILLRRLKELTKKKKL